MKICVIYPDACSKSAKELAEALKCKAYHCDEYIPDVFDYTFYYGYGFDQCVNKIKTFSLLKKENVPIPEFTTSPVIAKEWKSTVVCRESAEGHGNSGLSYWYLTEKKNPKGKLFTKYFDHIAEYRIVVFKDKVVGRYRKDELEVGSWNLTLMQKKGFEDVDRSCLQAARALQIDYVGFDVLEAKDGSYVVLEANSGPILTEEAKVAITKYFKNLK